MNAPRWPGLLLGFSLGGFFDGILLHQVLQWHHLLSDVTMVGDLRLQLLADGLFHVLMYLIGFVGFLMLYRVREAMATPAAGHRLIGWCLAGFGVWHLLDALLSHWLLGIHRIKGDASIPLAWDLGWLVLFGLIPLWLAWRLLRQIPPDGGATPGHGGTPPGQGLHSGQLIAVLLTLSTIASGAFSARPSAAADHTVVVFAPGVSPGRAFNALAEAQARFVWTEPRGSVWVVRFDEPAARSRLYRQGALLVGNAGPGFGCIAWTRAAL